MLAGKISALTGKRQVEACMPDWHSALSDHVLLDQRPVFVQALNAERRQVEAAIGAVNDQLREPTADGGGLLQAVTAEAVG